MTRCAVYVASAIGSVACASQPARTVSLPAPVITLDTSLQRPTPPAPVRHPVQTLVDSVVSLPQFANMHWGVLIVSPTRGDTLAAHNADRLLMPASNMKLVTAAVALTQLSPDHVWRTTFSRTGAVRAGVLRGDLLVFGSGDPTVSVAMRGADPLRAFDTVVTQLRAAGIRRIDGRVLAGRAPAFANGPYGLGWEWDDLVEDYGAGVTELLFNEGFTTVHVSGCATPPRHACVTTSPLRTAPAVHGAVTVRAANSGPAQLTWWRDSAATPGITVTGNIAQGDSVAFDMAQPDVRQTYADAVTEALTRAGITVTGTRRPAAATDTPVATLTSLPLAAALPALQKPSQNQIAEALFKRVGYQRTGIFSADSGRVVVEGQLRAWGIRDAGFAIRDGSGLSRHDFLTPRTLVQVLDVMRRAPTFATYRDALPIGGVDGSLRNRMTTTAQGRVWAKTGSFDKARALSGYVLTADGDTLLFSLMANNFSVPSREVDRVADLIVERLAQMRSVAP